MGNDSQFYDFAMACRESTAQEKQQLKMAALRHKLNRAREQPDDLVCTNCGHYFSTSDKAQSFDNKGVNYTVDSRTKDQYIKFCERLLEGAERG